MNSQALQDLVKRIFADEETKRQFTADPRGFLATTDLTDEEKKAVLSTQARLGLVTSSGQVQAGPMAFWY